MNTHGRMTRIKKVLAILAALALGASPALVRAETTVDTSATAGIHASSTNASVSARLTASETRTRDRGAMEIDRRIANLTKLSTRVGDIKNLSDADKTTIRSTIAAQVTALQGLKTKIAADTDSATLKTDVQSITSSYRVYALLIPQVEIVAAADRIVTIAKEMQELGTKLQARISTAQTAGVDVSKAANAFTDYTAKTADAQSQAQAAVTAIAVLQPDQGDKTKFDANATALKDARAKVVLGQKDLKAAYQDAQIIMKGVRGKDGHATSTPSVHASTTTSVGAH